MICVSLVCMPTRHSDQLTQVGVINAVYTQPGLSFQVLGPCLGMHKCDCFAWFHMKLKASLSHFPQRKDLTPHWEVPAPMPLESWVIPGYSLPASLPELPWKRAQTLVVDLIINEMHTQLKKSWLIHYHEAGKWKKRGNLTEWQILLQAPGSRKISTALSTFNQNPEL